MGGPGRATEPPAASVLDPGGRHRTGTKPTKAQVRGGSAVWESVEPLTEAVQEWPTGVHYDREGAGSSTYPLRPTPVLTLGESKMSLLAARSRLPSGIPAAGLDGPQEHLSVRRLTHPAFDLGRRAAGS